MDNYGHMSDNELLELAMKPEDLTEVAREVLGEEMTTRRLKRHSAEIPAATITSISRKNYDLLAGPLADTYVVPSDAVGDASGLGGGSPDEYTWKTRLCECTDVQQARQLAAALERAGIESWVEAMPSYAIGVGSPHVLVPADKLEEAREIAARPIPQDIVDDSKIEDPEYVMPDCPKCGAHDPILESAEPVNTWLCESCNAEWTDTPPADDRREPAQP